MKAIESWLRKHGVVQALPAWLVVMVLVLGPGCAGQDDVESPLATLAASDRATSELGVTTWKVLPKGDDVRVVGRDAASVTQVEMIIQRDASAPDDLVRIETLLPEHGVFNLSRAGVVDGTSSSYLQSLGAAVYVDLGQHSDIATTTLLPDGLGAATSAVVVQNEGHPYMPWSVFGYSVDEIVDNWCAPGTRAYWDAYSSYGNASCWVVRWATDNPTDCRILLHRAIAGWRTDVCNWYVYMNP